TRVDDLVPGVPEGAGHDLGATVVAVQPRLGNDDAKGLCHARRRLYLPILAARMAPRRVRFRPPGAKPWTRIGPFGPFRGRLGLQWVVAPVVLGVVLLLFAWALLFRSS